MCGVVGWLSWQEPPTHEPILRMSEELRHRGPDAAGVKDLGPLILGHRRLSVVDLAETSNQPLCDVSGRYWISYNGEIYNFRELRRELESHGVIFRTAGDTEVIVEAYKKWGIDFLQRLNGMFAFALWDARSEILILARDRVGEKPLFYSDVPNGGLIFASELQSLGRHPLIRRVVDPTALGQYLALNYCTGDRTLWRSVWRLPAGHYMLCRRNQTPTIRSYWDLASKFGAKRSFSSLARAAEELDALLDDAVRIRLVSDVPLGAFLSGGIDSSAVVAGMARQRDPTGVETFSIGFNEPSFDEVANARAVADNLGVRHRDEILAPDLDKIVPALMRAATEPIADSSFLPTYLLAGFTRRHVTVALSGDGGDEVFGGYETYKADALHHRLRRMPKSVGYLLNKGMEALIPASHNKVSWDYKIRQFLSGMDLDARRAHVHWRNILTGTERAAVISGDLAREIDATDPFEPFEAHFNAVSGRHFLDQSMYVDIKTWLADNILVKVDRATMAHSLESRAPFLDHRVIEFAASLPIEFKLKGFRTKRILKASQKRHLPPEVIYRRKQGFNAPVSGWISRELLDFTREVLGARSLEPWFNRTAVDTMLANHLSRKQDNGLKMLGLLTLALWLEKN